MLPDWKNRKDVENRDYRHLSQFEIGGGKRISQQLSVPGALAQMFERTN
jgi:hypothetical protein